MLAIAITLFSCKKMSDDDYQPGQMQHGELNYGTDQQAIDAQGMVAGKGKGKGQQQSTATPFHYFSIRDSIGLVAGVQRLFFIGEQIVPFPPGSTMWDVQKNYSFTDSNSAVPAQHAEFIFSGANSAGFNPNYFPVYIQNYGPGGGPVTCWFVGENYTGSDPFCCSGSNWYTTGSALLTVTWNPDGSLSRTWHIGGIAVTSAQ